MYSSWPALPERYDVALRLAVSDIETHYQPIGVIAAGSILRGQGGPTSDIDLFVIHQQPFRQRLQRLYNGAPFEIFINPPQQVRRYFEEEQRSARPITAHMLATGIVLLDHDPIIQTLRNEAAQWLATPPNPSPDSLRWSRYLTGDLLDNARDVVDADPDVARLFLQRVIQAVLDYRFLIENQNLPRPKDVLHALQALDASCAALVQQALNAQPVAAQLAAVTTLVGQTMGVTGYFEWDSAPDPVPD